jgi:signal transduction histidine kinase
MKLKWKIYIMCMSIYMITLTASAIAVAENTYSSQLNREIQRALQEEKNIHDSTLLYLVSNQKLSLEKVDIKDYGKRIVDIFTNESVSLELYEADGQLIESNINKQWSFRRDDLERLLKEGKNYVVRVEDNKTYLFINDFIQLEGKEILMSYIKDISELQNQKKEQYIFFLRTGAVGLAVIAIIVELLSRILIKPVKDLGRTAEKIAAGSFKERVEAYGQDEISNLGAQFNIMAEEVEKRISELEDAGERKQKFIDNLTHELRTPLTSIIGYSELLQKLEYDKIAFNKGLYYIHSEGMRMLRLANTLMDMILLRKGSISMEKVYIPALLKEVSELMKPRAKEKNIELVVKEEKMELCIDRDMIKGVLLNLIDNSMKASLEGTRIEIGCEIVEQLNYIYVEDEGRGLEQEEIPRIIEPFYRTDNARGRKEGGAGLGLALCQQIVDSHNGKLSIESTIGKGTKVSIILKNLAEGGGGIA